MFDQISRTLWYPQSQWLQGTVGIPVISLFLVIAKIKRCLARKRLPPSLFLCLQLAKCERQGARGVEPICRSNLAILSRRIATFSLFLFLPAHLRYCVIFHGSARCFSLALATFALALAQSSRDYRGERRAKAFRICWQNFITSTRCIVYTSRKRNRCEVMPRAAVSPVRTNKFQ